jgi:hypothetical protein
MERLTLQNLIRRIVLTPINPRPFAVGFILCFFAGVLSGVDPTGS